MIKNMMPKRGKIKPRINANRAGVNIDQEAISKHVPKPRTLQTFFLPLVSKKTIKPMNAPKTA